MKQYYDFVIKTDRGNRDALKLVAQIVDWTEKNQVYAYLEKIVPAKHESKYANEFDIHLCIEKDNVAFNKFKDWCEENADSLWAFNSFTFEEAAE